MMAGMTKAKIAISIPRDLLAEAKRAVKERRATSVSAYVEDAVAEKARRDRLRVLLDEMLAETGGPTTPEERRVAEERLGLRKRRRGRAA